MSDYSNPINNTIYEIDDVAYEIEVFKTENNEYYGRWTCLKNNQTGTPSQSKTTIEQIISDSKTNAKSYHSHTFGAKSSG